MIIIDSDILIRFSRGDDVAANWLEAAAEATALSISVVTKLELFVGCRDKKHLDETRNFLSRYPAVSINEAISDRASYLIEKYNLSHGLLIPDALIAATAIEVLR